jgi:hypothetical protein
MDNPALDEIQQAAMHVKGAMDMHALAGASGQYCVFYLGTGKPVTNDTYPARGIARQFAEKKTSDALLILQVAPDGIPLKEAECCLKYERALYKGGYRTPDYDWESMNSALLEMPRNDWDKRRMAKQLISGKPLYPEGTPYGNLPGMNIRKGK